MVLAVGSPRDYANIGATWIFRKDASGFFRQFGHKLIGTDFAYPEGYPYVSQGIS